MTRDGRLGVGIIGAGRVGPVVGAALGGAGHAVIGITSGSDDERASAVLPDVPVLEALEVVRRAELRGHRRPLRAAALVGGGHRRGGRLAGRSARAPHRSCVRHRGAPPSGRARSDPPRRASCDHLHRDLDRPSTAPGRVRRGDGSSRRAADGSALAVEMGCEPVVIAETDRAAYADAIATATEFSRSIIGQSTARLREIGVENPGGYLSALVQSTVERALREASDAPPLI